MISRESTDIHVSYLVNMFLLQLPVHVVNKIYHSSSQHFVFWSQLQAPKWRKQPRLFTRSLMFFVGFFCEILVKTLVYLFKNAFFIMQSTTMILHISSEMLFIIEIQHVMNISWVEGGAYAIFSKSHALKRRFLLNHS